jgi:hypothetical protein
VALACQHDTAVVWAAVPILLITYFVLNKAGVADSRAAFWAPTAAALVAVLLLWRAARNSVAPTPEPVPRAKLARRVLTLALLTYLSTSLVSGLVAGFVPAIPSGGSPDQAIAINLRLSTTVAWPISLIILLRLGHLSATWLAVGRPLRWLVMISAVPALVSIALHPVAVAFSQNFGSTPPRGIEELAPRAVVGTVLFFCALALGNLSGRESPARHPSPKGTDHGADPGGADSGEVAAPDRATS